MGVIIPTLKLVVFALMLSGWQGLMAQQAPVTRAEFAGLFVGIARGYVADETKALPLGFVKDSQPITRTEVASALVHLARQSGKNVAEASNSIEALKIGKLLPSNAGFFSDRGQNFRPQDLIAVLVAFAENFSNQRRVQSDLKMALTTPKIKK